jgi:hypothetical protein
MPVTDTGTNVLGMVPQMVAGRSAMTLDVRDADPGARV